MVHDGIMIDKEHGVTKTDQQQSSHYINITDLVLN